MRVSLLRGAATVAALALVPTGPAPSRAGVVNPDISVIGQPFGRWSDAASDPGRRRLTLDAGETEVVFDAALNPYARGTVVASLGESESGIEEAYFTMTRGLPLGLALKGGRYRAGFGRLNAQHPHVYPFAERFHVLAEYLPGEEAFDETGVQLSEQLALPGDVALTLTGDWLQGDSFRRPRASSGAAGDPLERGGDDRAGEPRPAGLARAAAFVPLGERSGIELGASFTQGTNNVAAGTRTTVAGGDLKLKWWDSPVSYLLVQAEALSLDREDAGWDSTGSAYSRSRVTPAGAYVYADYNFRTRYNAGASFERWQSAGAGEAWNSAFGLFAGLALMEETTAFRAGWERLQAGAPAGASAPAAVNTFTLRVVWSMGPHKAHQF